MSEPRVSRLAGLGLRAAERGPRGQSGAHLCVSGRIPVSMAPFVRLIRFFMALSFDSRFQRCTSVSLQRGDDVLHCEYDSHRLSGCVSMDAFALRTARLCSRLSNATRSATDE